MMTDFAFHFRHFAAADAAFADSFRQRRHFILLAAIALMIFDATFRDAAFAPITLTLY
jgi:hypothetical protein